MTAQNRAAIWLAAGGTGGHIFPATSLADALVKAGQPVVFITDRRGKKLLDAATETPAYPIEVIPSASPFAGGILRRITACLKLAAGGIILMIKRLKHRPCCVVGFGGYPSFMPAFTARLSGIPLIMHEQNAVMGRSNRALAHSASLVMTSWPETTGLPQTTPHLHTGLPIRSGFDRISAYQPSSKEKLQLLILGGSQGASLFGRMVVEAVTSLPQKMRDSLNICQQVRAEQLDEVQSRYAQAQISATIAPFFADVPQLMAQSDIVLSRAGASSVAEIATAGRAAILIPFAGALDNHQTANAQQLAAHNAAILMEEKDCTAAGIASLITRLATSADTRTSLAQQARAFAHIHAAAAMADTVLGYTDRPQEIA